ncbi:TonB family protein [Sandaracinobacter sp. RS1-74]|uniref:energy transducer TonB family protein n=1 Tax=Sandaracinobacteroides sayramensis TaxID=2913411 RepID=UPI001EDABB86|nr:TonB family protein [Sandaracinobacteroides sayramensis]MCG2841232.1 TonB family protein [Sandaracinobacteroides sayramensis]
MIEDISSRLFAILLSLLAHAALFSFLFLLSPPPGDGGRSAARGRQGVLVVELIPLDRDKAGDPARQLGFPSATDKGEAEPMPPRLPSSAATRPATEPPPAGGANVLAASASASAPGQAADLSGVSALRYRDMLLTHIARYRQYPEEARRDRREGTAWVRFLLDRKGRVSRIWIERSSGHAALDGEAAAAVRRAEPLPPIPAGLPDEIDITVPIDFRIG